MSAARGPLNEATIEDQLAFFKAKSRRIENRLKDTVERAERAEAERDEAEHALAEIQGLLEPEQPRRQTIRQLQTDPIARQMRRLR